MAHKRCPTCRKLIPAKTYEKHRTAHRDQTRERLHSAERITPAQRKQILDRDGHACQICHATENLEIHHLDDNWRNNHPANLQTRCHAHNPRGTQTARSW